MLEHFALLMCAFASVVLIDRASKTAFAGLVCGFAVVLPFARTLDLRWVAIAAASAALLQLLMPVPFAAPVAAGALAGMTGFLMPRSIFSYPFALALPVAAAILSSRRQDFAPRAMRDEALLLIVVMGIALAAGPQIASGFETAKALNPSTGASIAAVPAWIGFAAAASIALGGIFSVWRHR